MLPRDLQGKFPEYPDEEEGGSEMIFKERDPAELEAELKEKVVHVDVLARAPSRSAILALFSIHVALPT